MPQPGLRSIECPGDFLKIPTPALHLRLTESGALDTKAWPLVHFESPPGDMIGHPG